MNARDHNTDELSQYAWDGTGPPDESVRRLEQALRPARANARPGAHDHSSRAPRRAPWTIGVVGGLVGGLAAAAITLVWWFAAPAGPSMNLRVTAGEVEVSGRGVTATHTWRTGQWLDTASGEAVVTVGTIGDVTVRRGSRLRLLETGDTHRLELARGEISAFITAPPRLFFVETPVVTAIDMGCAYDLAVDEFGAGSLRVTSGWVELAHPKQPARVPALASCPIDKDRGPGTPRFDDAPTEWVQQLDAFDGGAAGALPALLAGARTRDGLSLWHLLQRTQGADRAVVFARLTELVPLPEGFSAEQAMNLDAGALEAWWREIRWAW